MRKNTAMKMALSLAMAIVFAFAAMPTTAVYANQPIRVATRNLLDGDNAPRQYLTFADVQPQIINDRVFVPLRGVPSHIVGSLSWFQGDAFIPSHVQSVFRAPGDPYNPYNVTFIQPGNNTVARTSVDPEMWDFWQENPFTGSGNPFVNPENQHINVSVAAQIVDGRTMLPVLMFEEIFPGVSVTWEESTRTVIISYMAS